MKKVFFLLLIVSGISSVYAQTLSLKEKQAIANLDFSWSEKRILDNLGATVKIEVDKESFAGDMDAILYADSRGAQTAANAIAKICNDKIGKEELSKKKLTKVILKNTKSGKQSISLQNGVLTVLAGFSSSDRYFGESDLQTEIENLL